MFVETRDKSSKVDGLFGGKINLYLNLVAKESNVTIKFMAYHGFGDKATDSDAYNGCFGRVQRGEAETIFAMVDYPMDIVNVSQGHVLFDDRIGFVGSFPQVKFEPYDFTCTIASFDVAIWMTIIAFLILFRIFIWIKLKLTVEFYSPQDKLLRRGDYTYRTLAHFTTDGEIESNDNTMKVTYITLTYFSFLVITMFSNLINTGLVVSRPPLIFENYDDLIKYNVRPSFMDQLYDFRYFKYAKPGTEENKFWTWAVEKFSEKKIMTVPDPGNFIHVAFGVANQKRVFFSSINIIRPLRWTMCNFLSRKEKDLKSATGALGALGVKDQLNGLSFQSYIRFGKNMKWMTKQIIFKKDSKHTQFIVNLIARVVEHGHIVYIREGIQKTNMVQQVVNIDVILGKVDPSRRIFTENCLSSQPQDVERTADEMSIVTFSSLRTFLKIMFACLFIAFLFLALERFVLKPSRAKRRSSVKKPKPHPLRVRRATNAVDSSGLQSSRWRNLTARSRLVEVSHFSFKTKLTQVTRLGVANARQNNKVHPEPCKKVVPRPYTS